MHYPKEGEFITVKSYKHDGSFHRAWQNCMIIKTSEESIIAVNDHTPVIESDGRRWVTREPALLYFHKKYWFNIVTMLRKGGVSYYSNLASPFVLDEEALKYIDYDLDVKIFPDGRVKLLDLDEYKENSQKWEYGANLDLIIKSNLGELLRWIKDKRGPFSQAYVTIWYKRYCQLSQRNRQKNQSSKHKSSSYKR